MMITESKQENYYEGIFGKTLIGLTINNKTSKGKNEVTIIFDHQTYSVKLLIIFTNLV